MPGATGSPEGPAAVFGGTKGGFTGAGGAGKSTTDERDLAAGTFFAGAAAFTSAFAGATLLSTFSTGFAGGDTFSTGFSAMAFFNEGAFLAAAAGLDTFPAGSLAAAADFAGLTADFACPITGAVLGVVFFAAMAH